MSETVTQPDFSWEMYQSPTPVDGELSFAERLDAMTTLAFSIQLKVGLTDYFLWGADTSLVSLMEYVGAPRPKEAVVRLRVVHKVLLQAQQALSTLHENSDVDQNEKVPGEEAILGCPPLDDSNGVDSASLGRLVGSLSGLTSRMMVTFSAFATRCGKTNGAGTGETRQDVSPTFAATLKSAHTNMIELSDLCENIGQLIGCAGTTWSPPTDTVAIK